MAFSENKPTETPECPEGSFRCAGGGWAERTWRSSVLEKRPQCGLMEAAKRLELERFGLPNKPSGIPASAWTMVRNREKAMRNTGAA